MEKYILSIDQGTTSSRAMLFDKNGKQFAMAQREVTCLFPHPGWVEVDATSIYISVVDCISEILIKNALDYDYIDSIGITNQRETTVVWDRITGQPVCNAIVWQSRQSLEICERFSDKKELIHEKTGLLINPYFSASKIRFILDHIPNGQQRAEAGELLFGTIDTWLMFKMSHGIIFATDVTNASRTMLFNINTMKWDDELCSMFNIPTCMLPEVLPSSYRFGNYIAPNGARIPICGVAGDQQAALFGQTCFEKGECKNTYGTGCFMLMNIGSNIALSKNGLLTTVAWKINDEVTYALEGSVFMGGASVQWLRDQMKIMETASESESMALSCKDSGGIYVVPAFTGLGTPYWDDNARGAVFGLTRGTNRNQFARATLEGIAYQCKDVFEVMKKETGLKISSLKVDGGATANNYLMQFQSDILSTEIKLPTCLQTTALGACYLAGLASGFFKSIEDIKKIHSYQKVFKAKMKKVEIKNLYHGWKMAVKATRIFKTK